MAELVDALDSGSSICKDVRVQISPSAPNLSFIYLASSLTNIKYFFFAKNSFNMKYSITLILFFSFINFSLLGQPADDAEATAGDTGTAPAASTPAANSASDSAPAAPAAAPQAASMVTAPAPAPAVSTAVESNTLVTAVQAGIDIADAVELGSSNIKKLVVKDGEFSGASISDVVTQFKTRAKL